MLTEGNRHSGVVRCLVLGTNRISVGSKFLDFAHGVSERRRFRGCGVSLGRLGFAGGLEGDGGCQCCQFGVRLTDIDFGSQINTGFSFKSLFI